jgi:hypothetical protein
VEAIIKLKGKAEDISALVQMAMEAGVSLEFSTSANGSTAATAKPKATSGRGKPKFKVGDKVQAINGRSEYGITLGMVGTVSAVNEGTRGYSYDLEEPAVTAPGSLLKKVRK